jgi:16S rRNA (guanine966-N2)-methyltransferase
MTTKIIGGKIRNFILKTPKGDTTRPILARIKKSLFDIIRPYIDGADFLDLFSGSGSIGIEAYSRGAKFVSLVEKDRRVCECIKQNLEYCKIMDNFHLSCLDVFKYIAVSDEKFDIIFAGPPYPLNFSQKVLDAVSNSSLLKENGIFIIQHHIKEKISDKAGKFVLYREEKYGDTILSFYKRG